MGVASLLFNVVLCAHPKRMNMVHCAPAPGCLGQAVAAVYVQVIKSR